MRNNNYCLGGWLVVGIGFWQISSSEICHSNSCLEDITLNTLPFFLLCLLYILSMRPHGVGYPSWSVGISCPVCVPSQFLLNSQWWWGEGQKRPWCCASPAQQKLKQPWIIKFPQQKSKTHSRTNYYEENTKMKTVFINLVYVWHYTKVLYKGPEVWYDLNSTAHKNKNYF